MGMPGMTNDAVAAYAATASDKVNDKASRMTVAEFRNRINPTTHYYDNYDVDNFLLDSTIGLKEKIEVLLGKMVEGLIDTSKLENIIKKELENIIKKEEH